MDRQPCCYKNDTYFPKEVNIHVGGVEVIVKHNDAASVHDYCEQNWEKHKEG